MVENTWAGFETVFVTRRPPGDKRVGELLDWGKKLSLSGLSPESSGNLSFRTEHGFVITGTGINLGAIRENDLVEFLRKKTSENKTLIYVDGEVFPSKESLLHLAIYDLRAEVMAVFHVHDRLVLERADELGIPATGKEQPGGSSELAEEARRLLSLKRKIKYFVLKNHGVVAMGRTLEEAGKLVGDMNKLARR